jgi:hypothetical protein
MLVLVMNSVFVIILSLYYLFGLALIGVDIIHVKHHQVSIVDLVYSASTIITLPVLGIFIVLLFRIPIVLHNSSLSDLESEINFSGVRSDVLYRSDVNKEMNIVPMEEALIINNNQIKRSLLIEALKKDFFKSIYFIKKAITDTDTETSHYAAAALMELKDKLTRELRKAREQYNMDKSNVQNIEKYAHAMKQMIESSLVSTADQDPLLREYVHTVEHLTLVFPNEQKYYIDLVNYLLKKGEYMRAEGACAMFLQNAAESETPYMLYLKIYYEMGMRNEFNVFLSRLQSSSVKLSSNALNMLRFWLQKGTTNGK